MKRQVEYNGVTFDVDFSEDECERRMIECVRRCGGMKPSFNMETGQPFEGPQLSQLELRRRGYD